MIVACPTCDSRYDLTGQETIRCRCGTTVEAAPAAMQAGMLACPHCGAGVSPTSPRCGHCTNALLLKACPRCTHRVFHGHKHCPQCGTQLDLAAIGEHKDLPCPRCDAQMHGRLVGDVVIDECTSCAGVFLDQVAVERIITDRAQARADAVLGALPRPEPKPARQQKLYVKCPSCGTVMNRKLFASGSGVIVDVCRKDGTFFDVGELPQIIEFVMKGGLEVAARKDAERMIEQLRREKADAQSAQLAASLRAPVSRRGDSGTALVQLLVNLFR
jgi:Zn-finger nucleic acid-binding protein